MLKGWSCWPEGLLHLSGLLHGKCGCVPHYLKKLAPAGLSYLGSPHAGMGGLWGTEVACARTLGSQGLLLAWVCPGWWLRETRGVCNLRCTAGTSHITTGVVKEALRAKAATKKNHCFYCLSVDMLMCQTVSRAGYTSGQHRPNQRRQISPGEHKLFMTSIESFLKRCHGPQFKKPSRQLLAMAALRVAIRAGIATINSQDVLHNKKPPELPWTQHPQFSPWGGQLRLQQPTCISMAGWCNWKVHLYQKTFCAG